MEESETDRERIGKKITKGGKREDGEEKELGRSSTFMQFVNVEAEVLTAMPMKFPTFGHMTLQRLVCRYKCYRKARHLIFKVYNSLQFPEE